MRAAVSFRGEPDNSGIEIYTNILEQNKYVQINRAISLNIFWSREKKKSSMLSRASWDNLSSKKAPWNEQLWKPPG